MHRNIFVRVVWSAVISTGGVFCARWNRDRRLERLQWQCEIS
jgi:hypothetical protein